MKRFIKKIAVMTSGGDSPGLNAAIRAVVRSCAYYKLECSGIYRGYQGMIEGDIVPMSARDVHHIIQKGGTVLKSARSKEFRTVEGRKKAHEALKKHNENNRHKPGMRSQHKAEKIQHQKMLRRRWSARQTTG